MNPAEKIAIIEHLKAQGLPHALMVGDGLNDAPALAAAYVSLSPISAAAITQAQADAVFLGDRLRPVLVAVVAAAPGATPHAAEPLAGRLYNAIAVPMAIAGYVTPLIAAVAMSGSSLLVTCNALHARRSTRS